jgi:uncharacterized protein YkwD
VDIVWGTPSRIIEDWSVYHDDLYTEFSMVFFRKGRANAIYTMREGWDAEALKTDGNIKEYADKNDSGRKYALMYYTNLRTIDTPLDDKMIFEITNGFRGQHGIAPLTWDGTLAEAARIHSKDMRDNNYFDHADPQGNQAWDRAEAAGYSWAAIGENISKGYRNSVGAVDGWVNSPSHRKCMLDGIYTELGVGVSGTYATQVFGTPK